MYDFHPLEGVVAHSHSSQGKGPNKKDADALEQAVKVVNQASVLRVVWRTRHTSTTIAVDPQVLSLGDMFGGLGGDGGASSSRGSKKDNKQLANDSDKVEGKWVAFRAKAMATEAAVPGDGTTAVAPGRSLEDYLALPLEEYSLLDPKLIAREAEEAGCEDSITCCQAHPCSNPRPFHDAGIFSD